MTLTQCPRCGRRRIGDGPCPGCGTRAEPLTLDEISKSRQLGRLGTHP